MFELIIDDDIALRLHDMDAVETYFQLIRANHDHIGRYMDWVDNHQTVENTRDYVLFARKQFAEREEIVTRIYFRGKLVGSIGLIFRDKDVGVGEIGYWLDEAATGKGIMTRAARAMTDYGFTTLGLHKIIIRAMTDNERSLAIPQRLGFQYEGLTVHAVRRYGAYHDFETYYTLADDWIPTCTQPEFSHHVDDEVELRIFEPRHAEALFALTLANIDFVGKWLTPVKDNTTLEATVHFIEDGLKQYAKRDGLQMGIWYQGTLCGACGYHYWDFNHRKTEIGYWLAETHTGKGIMTRTVKAMVDYVFDVQKLHRVEIYCAVGNTKSCAIPTRLGFTHEGVIRGSEHINGEFHDANIYAVLSHTWGA